MKKILVLLAVLLVAGTAFAQDVYWSGWLETKGGLATDAATVWGPVTLDWDLTIAGEGWGAHTLLETWASDASGVAAPAPGNAYIYADYLDGMLRLQGGHTMQLPAFAPATAVGGGIMFNDAFGLGMGRYNYESDGYKTGAVTGLYTQINADALTVGLVLRMDTAAKFADALQNAAIINVKYDIPETATIYAGYATDIEAEGTQLWFAASIAAVENLLADLKFEMSTDKWTNVLGNDSQTDQMAISANLGYDLGIVNIATETVLVMHSEVLFGYWLPADDFMQIDFGLNASTSALEVVDVALLGKVHTFTFADNDVLLYGASLKFSKSIGNVGNSIEFNMQNSTADKAEAQFKLQYAINIWF